MIEKKAMHFSAKGLIGLSKNEAEQTAWTVKDTFIPASENNNSEEIIYHLRRTQTTCSAHTKQQNYSIKCAINK